MDFPEGKKLKWGSFCVNSFDIDAENRMVDFDMTYSISYTYGFTMIIAHMLALVLCFGMTIGIFGIPSVISSRRNRRQK